MVKMKSSLSDGLRILFWVVLGGAIVWGYSAATSKKAEKSALATSRFEQRKTAVQATVKAGPQVFSNETPEGTVIQLSIPAPSQTGNFVDVKRCIVWRDAATKTSSLHCDHDELDLDDSHLEPPDLSDYR